MLVFSSRPALERSKLGTLSSPNLSTIVAGRARQPRSQACRRRCGTICTKAMKSPSSVFRHTSVRASRCGSKKKSFITTSLLTLTRWSTQSTRTSLPTRLKATTARSLRAPPSTKKGLTIQLTTTMRLNSARTPQEWCLLREGTKRGLILTSR